MDLRGLRRLRPLFAAVAACALVACDAPPDAASLPEWTPADHDRSEELARAGAQTPAAPAPSPSGKPGRKGPDPVLEAAWAEQCAQCHGVVGRGDGPTGPMVHAADLTRADWQATVTDEQLAASIVNGKGKMPPFPNLPPKIVAGLVGRIRSVRGR